MTFTHLETYAYTYILDTSGTLPKWKLWNIIPSARSDDTEVYAKLLSNSGSNDSGWAYVAAYVYRDPAIEPKTQPYTLTRRSLAYKGTAFTV